MQKLLQRMHPHTRGRLAEHLVLLVYLARGYTPLPRTAQRRLQQHVQLDLLLRRGRSLLLVEVKYRTSGQNLPFALHPGQQRRLQQALNQAASKAFQLWPGRFTAFQASIAHVSLRWPFVKTLRLH